ncbi:MAG: hypothetical protein E7158_01875 [Firmicutes bacterium]|nr:hypothetical protein [Bacillota bacterium]
MANAKTGTTSVASKGFQTLRLTHLDTDKPYVDPEKSEEYANRIKNELNELDTIYRKLQNIFSQFANSPSTKGTVKKSADKMVDRCKRHVKSNADLSALIVSSLNNSQREIIEAYKTKGNTEIVDVNTDPATGTVLGSNEKTSPSTVKDIPTPSGPVQTPSDPTTTGGW